LLESVSEAPALLVKMEPVVMPLILFVLNPDLDVSDYLEGTLTALSYLTYYFPLPLPNSVWTAVGRIATLFDTYAFDYLQEFAVPLEHLCFRDPSRFANGSDEATRGRLYVDTVFHMCRRVLEDTSGQEGASEKDLRAAVGLLAAMLQALPGPHIFAAAQADIFRMCTYWLVQKDSELSKSTRVRFFEVFESCFFHCPHAVVQVLGQDNLRQLLGQLRQIMPEIQFQRKRKMCALGLLALLVVEEVSASDKALIVAMVCELLHNMDLAAAQKAKEDGEEEKEEEDLIGEEDDGAPDEEGEEFDEDEDAANEEDEAYVRFLRTTGDTGGAYWDDDEAEEDLEDPEEYPWPLDAIDVKQSLTQGLAMALHSSSGPALRTCIQQFDPQVQEQIAQYTAAAAAAAAV
jgi:hypothetical protein